jgi:hypothetical protein
VGNNGPPGRIQRPGDGATGPRRVDRGRGYRNIGDHRVEVYDLDLAAYFDLKGLAIADAHKSGRETIIVFYDPKDRIKTLAVEWLNSEASQFASRVRQLKKVVYSTARHH